ncbi:hypothetical protein BJY01DRAFT_256085 [Aspergillus pseudoustus]|uniref:AA9 family lytic polysaccharide monooxygenase n=1 Tax=Aspergillus pseudoustus TaxID=1810923 RepID=A0ABR4IEL6_9EURO
MWDLRNRLCFWRAGPRLHASCGACVDGVFVLAHRFPGNFSSIGVHGAHAGEAEFYYECAQVKVIGGGNGTPGPTIKFPGGYKQDDPSFNFSVWGGMKEYPMPGPEVWTSTSSSSPASNGGNEDESAGHPQLEQANSCGSSLHRREHARDFSH